MCGNNTKFISIKFGYNPHCSRSCGAKKFKINLKNDKEKFQTFSDKVKRNMENIWKNREDTGEPRKL
jgi:hypothetical protein